MLFSFLSNTSNLKQREFTCITLFPPAACFSLLSLLASFEISTCCARFVSFSVQGCPDTSTLFFRRSPGLSKGLFKRTTTFVKGC